MDAETTAVEQTTQGPNPVWYIVAVMSVMPLAGIFFGVAALLRGLTMFRRGGRLIAILGALGLGGQSLFFTFLLHAALQ